MKLTGPSRILVPSSLATLCLALPCRAAVLARYEFPSGSAAATSTATGVDAASFVSSVSGSSQGFSAGGNAFVRSLVTGADETAAIADDNYFSVTISAANVGETLDLTSLTLDYGLQNDNTSVFTGTVYLQSSVGGLGAGNSVIVGTNTTDTQNFAGVSFSQAVFDLSGPAFQGLATITFEIRFSDNVDVNGDISRFDNVTLNGTVVPESSSVLLGGLGVLVLLRRRRI